MYFYKKTKRIFLYLILFILFLFISFLVYDKVRLKETFKIREFPYNINYYVITMGQPNRLENITKQVEKLNELKDNNYDFKLNHIDAIRGDDLDLTQLSINGKISKEILSDPQYNAFLKGEEQLGRRKYEVGCYMSHVKSINEIKESNADYGIIFEDDFEIEDNFFEELEKTIDFLTKNNVDYDIIFLGMNGPGIDIKHIGEKIYKQSCEFKDEYTNCYGLHGYLIPKKKVNKILPYLDKVDEIIDIKLLKLGEEGKLIIYRLIPDIVKQNSGRTGSVIR